MITDTDTIRPIPHALGIEKAVLSIIFQWPEMRDELPYLTVEHFHIPAHQTLLAQFDEYKQGGRVFELVQFVQFMLDKGLLDRVGGPAALYDIYTYQPTPTTLQQHYQILVEHKARRMAIKAGNDIVETAYGMGDTEELLSITSAPISDIHDTITGIKPKQTKRGLLERFIDRFNGLCAGDTSPMGIVTSMEPLNRSFKGLKHGRTIVISALPGGGKTTMALQLAADAALAGHRVRIFSLEMSEDDVMDKLIAYASGVAGDAVADPKTYAQFQLGKDGLSKEYLQKIKRGIQAIKEANIEIEDVSSINVYQIEAILRRAARTAKDDVVVVDYAQIMEPVPELRGAGREQQIAHASKRLRHIRKELGFCLIMPSQLTMDGKVAKTKHCAGINEDADIHLQVIYDEESKECKGVRCEKDRFNGNQGNFLPLTLDAPMLRFVETRP